MSKETFDQMLARVTAKRAAAPAPAAPTVRPAPAAASGPPPPPTFPVVPKK